MKSHVLLSLVLVALVACSSTARAQGVGPALQSRIDAELPTIIALAADPVIVGAVRAQNAELPPAYAAMTQDAWAGLTVVDPFVRSFSKNPAGRALKAGKRPLYTLAFLSDAAGLKVAFTAKTSNWSHKGMAKHDVPMTGKTWQGTIELNKASGQQQVQVAVPVLDEGKPIGSLVVGINAAETAQP